MKVKAKKVEARFDGHNSVWIASPNDKTGTYGGAMYVTAEQGRELYLQLRAIYEGTVSK